MSFKKYIIFGSILVCTGVFCIYFAAWHRTEQIPGLLSEPIPVNTRAGNLKLFIIAETNDDITVKSCGNECTINKIPKTAEQNGTKVYRSKHDVAIIYENGQWRALGNVFILEQMKDLDKPPRQIFGRGCGDWKIGVIEETNQYITVEDCKWGMGWQCSTYKIPKASDKNGIKTYKENNLVFTNNNGKWDVIGHVCAYDEPYDPEFLEENPGPIFQKNCLDFEMLITSETDKDITVRRDFRKTYNIPKVAEQSGIKVYSDGQRLYHKDIEAFINNNGKWELLGHLCSKVSSVEVLNYECPKYGRTIKINSYNNYGLIVAEIKDSNVSCKSKNDVLFMLKDASITDREVFVNKNFRIDHVQDDWIIDEKLCEIFKDCSTIIHW